MNSFTIIHFDLCFHYFRFYVKSLPQNTPMEMFDDYVSNVQKIIRGHKKMCSYNFLVCYLKYVLQNVI